jgi:hypothetical protein
MNDERPAGGVNHQFGQPLTPTDQGVDAVGQGRPAKGRSRLVSDRDEGHVEFELPMDEPPPAQQASGAAEAQAGQIGEDYPQFERNREALKQVPPGPSAWEAGIPDEDDSLAGSQSKPAD